MEKQTGEKTQNKTNTTNNCPRRQKYGIAELSEQI